MTLQAQKSERNHKQIGKISKKSKNMKETTISSSHVLKIVYLITLVSNKKTPKIMKLNDLK